MKYKNFDCKIRNISIRNNDMARKNLKKPIVCDTKLIMIISQQLK